MVNLVLNDEGNYQHGLSVPRSTQELAGGDIEGKQQNRRKDEATEFFHLLPCVAAEFWHRGMRP